MTPQTAPEPEPSARPMSELSRLTGVLLDPKTAFTDIARRPRWLVPLLLICLASVAYLYTYSQRVGWEHFMRQTIESNPRTENLPVAQREAIIRQQVRLASTFGYVGAVVGPPVYALVIAGVLLFLFNLILGAHLAFRQVFGITCYASLTGVVGTALAILMMFLKQPEDFDLRNPTAFNIGAYLDPQATPKWLMSLGTSIDLFSLWTILLLAVGLSVASRGISFGKALAWVVAPWLLWVLVKMVLPASFA